MIIISFKTAAIMTLVTAGLFAAGYVSVVVKDKIESKKAVKEMKKKQRHKEARDNVVYEYEY